MKVMNVLKAGLFILVLLSGCGKEKEISQMKEEQEVPDKIAAMVMEKAIYKDSVEAGIPDDIFGNFRSKVFEIRLERLISAAESSVYLENSGFYASTEEVESEFQRLIKNPPASGCSCCNYESLSQFMQMNFYLTDELKQDISVHLGILKKAEQKFNDEYKDSTGLENLFQQEKERIYQDYFCCSHIFLNLFQHPDYQKNPEETSEKLKAEIEQISKDLKNGASFEVLAAERSQDRNSAAVGGQLGCIHKNSYGDEFRFCAEKLTEGKISEPVQTPWGFHIIRKSVMTDEDVRKIIRDTAVSQIYGNIVEDIKKTSKVRRFP